MKIKIVERAPNFAQGNTAKCYAWIQARGPIIQDWWRYSVATLIDNPSRLQSYYRCL